MKNMYKTFLVLTALVTTMFAGSINFSANAEENNATDTMASNSTDMMTQEATLAFAQEMNMTEPEVLDMETNATEDEETHATEDEETHATEDEETHAMTSEEETHESEKEHSKVKTVRDSVTLLLEGKTLNAGSFIHLYDSTPFHIMNGHIAINVPCNDESVASVDVMIGVAPNLTKSELDYVAPLSNPGELCLYHADLISNDETTITDVAISNPGEDDIEFPEMSTVVLGINEIMPGTHMEHHTEAEQSAEHTEETPEEHT